MPKILVIEDEKAIRDTLQDLLELEGFEVLSAENGRLGIQIAHESLPDLIVCDVMMPEVDGYGVLEALHQNEATTNIPFIFLTAKADRLSVRQGMNLGADDYLVKPFTPQELLEALAVRLKKQATLIQPLNHKITHLNTKIDYQIFHDPVSDLPNRLSLQKIFTSLQSSAVHSHQQIPLFYINLNQLARIRIALGQEFCDRLLKLISQRLEMLDCVNSVAYVGGHQLALLLHPVGALDNIKADAERVLDTLTSAFLVNDYEIFLTPCLGVACYPQHGDSFDVLLSNAEIALTNTSNPSGTGIYFYLPHQQTQVLSRFEIEMELHQAVKHEQFQVYYQPQIDLKTGQLLGVEALIRWFHPERGAISPATFIPIAEENGLILLIGKWVLRTACTQVQLWRSQYPNLRLSVNISTKQLNDPHFLEDIFQVLDDTGLSADGLELEVTESALIQNSQLAQQIFNILKQNSVRVAIDDFGVGYSSFSYLQKFSLNALKIDQSFIRNLGGSFKDQQIVSAIIQMAHNMRLQVIAEGVEQENEIHCLRQFKCDLAQGYWFSEARSKSDFEQEFIAKPRFYSYLSSLSEYSLG